MGLGDLIVPTMEHYGGIDMKRSAKQNVTRAFVASLIVLLVLALPLVHLYGAVGAASASAAAMVIGNGLMWRDVRHHLAIDTSLLAWLPQRMQSHV